VSPAAIPSTPDLNGWWLAISTSAADWSVWLGRGRDAEPPFAAGQQRLLPGTRGQPRDLVGVIDDLLQTQGLAPADLAALVLDSGPGSFTGLRMGMATGRALAWSLNLPVAAVPSLQAMAAQALALGSSAPLGCVLAARRGWWYAGWYANAEAVTAPPPWDASQLSDADLGPALAVRAVGAAWAGVGPLPEGNPARTLAETWRTDATPQACWAAYIARKADRWGPAQLALPEYLGVSEAEAAAQTVIAQEPSEAVSQLAASLSPSTPWAPDR
jgi:tRNA threonylcarbamoyl adenosine modification protein YeaZ